MRETTRAKRAYADFVALGEGRTLVKLLEWYQANPRHAQARRIDRLKLWSAHFKWHDRIDRLVMESAAGAEQAERERLAARRLAHADKILDTCEALLTKAQEMLKFPVAKVERKKDQTVISPAKWTFDTPARIVDTAAKLYSLAEQMRGAGGAANVEDLIERMSSELGLSEEAKSEALVYAEGYIKALKDGGVRGGE